MNEITIIRPAGFCNDYIVNLETSQVWVLKGGGALGRHARREYRSSITSERKIRKMIKLAKAQVAASSAS